MLELTNVEVYYGGIHALQGISIEVPDGKIVSLIGANGAGKSTTLNSIVGLVKPQSGSIAWNGKELTALGTKRIVSDGVVLVPEGRRIFPNLTTWENITLGAYHRSDKAGIERDRDMVYELFPRLKERAKQNAGTLSGGEQQMLAMGRALMASPKLLLLDEPSMGLAPILVDEIFSIIKKISAEGTTILLVEQNAYKALSVADRAYILETGAISKSGKAADLAADPAVKAAYLGG